MDQQQNDLTTTTQRALDQETIDAIETIADRLEGMAADIRREARIGNGGNPATWAADRTINTVTNGIANLKLSNLVARAGNADTYRAAQAARTTGSAS